MVREAFFSISAKFFDTTSFIAYTSSNALYYFVHYMRDIYFVENKNCSGLNEFLDRLNYIVHSIFENSVVHGKFILYHLDL